MKGNPRVIIAGEPNVGSWHKADFNSRLLLCRYWGNNGHRSCRGFGHSKLIKKDAFFNELEPAYPALHAP